MNEHTPNRTPGRRRAPGFFRRPAAARLLALALLAPALLAPWAAARARTFDEFQVFDGRIAETGGFDYNQHFVMGRRGKVDENGGAPRNGLLVMPEIGYATTTWHEVAVFLPVAREFSGDVFGGGFRVRNSFVVPGALDRPFAAGFDVVLRNQPYRFAESDWQATLRPILDLRAGPWRLFLNLDLEVPIGRGSPSFEPAVRLAREVTEKVRLGVEHFMDFGRVDRWETTRRQGHQLFATTDVEFTQRTAVQIGLGHGLTRNSDRWAGKVILRFDF